MQSVKKKKKTARNHANMADPNRNNNARNVNGNKQQHNGATSDKSTGTSQQQQEEQQQQQQQEQDISPAPADPAPAPPVNAFDRPTNIQEKVKLWCQDCMQRMRRQILQHTARTRPTQFAPDVGTNTRRRGHESTSSSSDVSLNTRDSNMSRSERKSNKGKLGSKISWIRQSSFLRRVPKKIECKGVYLYFYNI